MEIFGYQFSDIERAQQGGRLSKAIDPRAPAQSDVMRQRDADLRLLIQHGQAGLENMGYHGVLDRLKRAGRLEAPVYHLSRREVGMYEVMFASGVLQRRAGMVLGKTGHWSAESPSGRNLGVHKSKEDAAKALVLELMDA